MDQVNGSNGQRGEGQHIAILGAGMSGMCMGIQLRKAGIENFTIYEKASKVGGTWRDNVYPGVACDVPSHLYSFSFELNPDWSESYSGGGEIQTYCEKTAQKYGILPHIKFNMEIRRVEHKGGAWVLTFADGRQEQADIVVSALGGLHIPSMPDIEGQQKFSGTSFHTAEWNADHNVAGKRVGIIGNAASAVQTVSAIADEVAHLSIFQRTPNWIFPRDNKKYFRFTKWCLRHIPGFLALKRFLLYLRAEILLFPAFRQGSRAQDRFRRLAMDHLADKVKDPALREKLTPDYPVGCKRILFIDGYYEALQEPHIDLITSSIKGIEEKGIMTEDGRLHEFDMLIYATGFKPFNFLDCVEVIGPQQNNLADAWKDKVSSHRTVAVSGFPNFFMLLGPNSGLGHNSVIIMIEAQVRYIVQCVRALKEKRIASLDPKKQIEEAFNTRIQKDLQPMIWQAGCKSWYKNEDGSNHTIWPYSTWRYMREMAHPDFTEYSHRGNRPDV